MRVSISNNLNKTANKRLSQINIDNGFYSPISMLTKVSNGGSPMKNGYHINFFDTDRARKYFNNNMSTNNLKKRNKTPSKVISNHKLKKLPSTIRITNILDYRKKSKSKLSLQSPNKTSLDKKKKQIKEQINSSKSRNCKENSLVDSRKDIKIKPYHFKEVKFSHIDLYNRSHKKCNVLSKIIREDSGKNFRKKDSNIQKKRSDHLDSDDNNVYANEIPEGIRQKMIVYYQSNTIHCGNEYSVNQTDNPNSCRQKNNPINTIDINKPVVNWNANKDSLYQMKTTDLRTYNDSSPQENKILNENNNKVLSYSSPTIAMSNHRLLSKNRYRDLIEHYLSDDENNL